MAATVEGAFVIIDRATGPMRRMERQAQATDRAIDRLGGRMDEIGSPGQTRQMNDYERSMRNVDRSTKNYDQTMRTTSTTTNSGTPFAGRARP